MGLQIREHFADVFSVTLVYDSFVAEVPFAFTAFVLQQVVFERFTAHNFLTTAREFKALGGGFAGFEFRHNCRNFDTASHHIAIAGL